ncbi:hypothetical protein JTE90_021976 [Oedothorax gibbosus]|uniref:Macro domain-containing protein n=1 Tax=Oedothorax gibbosus TaxID=931172 RepID=A0AAV6U1G1_9ARAC|nr:hypothetical protein JTE90_021976 [Oedothorax gibbosus]
MSKEADMSFTEEKEKYLNMSIEDKRSQYNCKSKYVPLKKIPTWKEQSAKHAFAESAAYPKIEAFNEKVSIFVGDITHLEIDAIVNAANKTLLGGGGVDGAIHRAAGKSLLAECITLNGCETGEAKITGGYKLPAKYVIHTVGPIGEQTELLQNCYRNSLTVAQENGVRTIAFPCISTGVYRYPNKNAAHVALTEVRTFLEKNASSFDRVIFCLFLEEDVYIYENLIKEYFPV